MAYVLGVGESFENWLTENKDRDSAVKVPGFVICIVKSSLVSDTKVMKFQILKSDSFLATDSKVH